MERPQVLPLPGNSTREGNFYEEQTQAQNPEWPGNGSLPVDGPPPVAADPLPFKIVEGV